MTGVINTWNLLGGPYDFIATGYGRVLALKIGLFGAMLAIAAVNRFHLTPQLARARPRTAFTHAHTSQPRKAETKIAHTSPSQTSGGSACRGAAKNDGAVMSTSGGAPKSRE